MNRHYSSHSRSSPCQVPSGPLHKELDRIKAQIEFECFDKEYIAQAEEICLIIAEAFILPPAAEIQINKNKLTAETVQSVYMMLTHEDIITVMDNFEAASYNIRHKKTYLRTALYNEVFERSSRRINNERTYMPEYVSTRRDQISERQRGNNGNVHARQ